MAEQQSTINIPQHNSLCPLDEDWRQVIRWEGYYEVSSRGKVRRMAGSYNTPAPRLLTQVVQNSGYRMVSLWRDNHSSMRLAHRLVAESFCGPIPSGYDVNHEDMQKQHNCSTNLSYMTRSQNLLHAVAYAGVGLGELNNSAKLTRLDVLDIRRRYTPGGYRFGGLGYKALAQEYGVTWELIRNIIKRKIWTHV